MPMPHGGIRKTFWAVVSAIATVMPALADEMVSSAAGNELERPYLSSVPPGAPCALDGDVPPRSGNRRSEPVSQF